MGKLAKYSRRAFLIGVTAIAGGVAFGVYETRKSLPNPLHPGPGQATLNPYILIDAQGVTIITPRAEMGQGVQTTLAALVAEELDVEWVQIRTLHGPAAQAYYNGAILGMALPFKDYALKGWQESAKSATEFLPKMLGLQVTGGSTSMIDGFEKMRLAGATGREMLKQAASARMDVPADTLRTHAGQVIAPSGAALPYTDLAADAARQSVPRGLKLRPRAEWKYLGRDMPRVDLVAKSTGTAEYGADIRLAGMKFATLRMNPHRAGMQRFDASAAQSMPGVEKIVDLGDGVAVIATNTWLAMQAAQAIEIDWQPAAYPAYTAGLRAAIEAALDGSANSHLRDDGNAAKRIKSAADTPGAKVLRASYSVPYLAHATMEPMNATALYTKDALTLWSGNQAPIIARDKAAEAVGLKPAQVSVHTPYMGGGFGRRPEPDFSIYAARVAQAMPGVPVKTMWSREEDMTHDYYRPAAFARFEGVVENGTARALDARIAAPSVTRQSGLRLSGFAAPGPDKGHVEGAFDQPYGIPDYSVRGYLADVTVPVGFWRSVGNSFNGFFHESFIDEMAHAAGADPLEFRLALIRPVHTPSAKLLEKLREISGWRGKTPKGVGRGVAFTYSFGTAVGEVIEVRDTPDGIAITEAWIACDPGIALDPRNIRAQMKSAMIFGLSAAVAGEITFADGATEQQNFPDYDALRMNTAPRITVAVLENNPRIGGVGEPGTPPAAPALANALFDLTGTRARALPLGQTFDFAV